MGVWVILVTNCSIWAAAPCVAARIPGLKDWAPIMTTQLLNDLREASVRLHSWHEPNSIGHHDILLLFPFSQEE